MPPTLVSEGPAWMAERSAKRNSSVWWNTGGCGTISPFRRTAVGDPFTIPGVRHVLPNRSRDRTPGDAEAAPGDRGDDGDRRAPARAVRARARQDQPRRDRRARRP